MERIEHHASFDGWQDVYQHESTTLGCTMKVGVYLPPQAQHGNHSIGYRGSRIIMHAIADKEPTALDKSGSLD